tara:strand:- start:176 stop:1429 length:1254 start_codon:yes stop_codon:yes gene_type:complete
MELQSYPRPLKFGSVKNLRFVWNSSRDVGSAAAAAGIDGITPEQFRENLTRNLEQVHRKLLNGYRFHDLRFVPIRKQSGAMRAVCVPTVADRLVQRLALHHLTSHKDRLKIINPVSFGFIKGADRGTISASKRATELRNEQPWALKTDISAFFDNIDRQFLNKEIRKKLGNSSLVPILLEAVKCEIRAAHPKEKSEIEATGICRGRGLRQGMPLSPLLANFFLKDFDHKILGSGIPAIRYADDLIFFRNSRQECEEVRQKVESLLKELSLEIPSLNSANTKTFIKPPDEPVEFLGFNISNQGKAGEYRRNIPKTSMHRVRDKLTEYSNIAYLEREKIDISTLRNRINSIRDGYFHVYKDADNFDSFRDFMVTETNRVCESVWSNLLGEDALKQLSLRQKRIIGIAPFPMKKVAKETA